MEKITPERIQETRTLYEILPAKSASSGREFARIVNLLLFHEGRRNGRTLTIFDDRAGDYWGLDAFEREGDKITLGYQYKFYPSPLTNEHREKIEESLAKTFKAIQKKKICLKKWILVTPQDFIEKATRKTGGDITWFEELPQKYKLSFPLEHWGHTQLQKLFLEASCIGLYYYPELFLEGTSRRKSIQEIRTQYDKTLKNEYGRIEFVGMSIYKEEAARTIPMENIYIPLTVVSNDANENDPNVHRRNPIELLAPGNRHVLLGDPGAGKTTLLRFLALFGQSESLQRRYTKNYLSKEYSFERDERLPILVTLRRYADTLKINDTLSLLDYISENIAADFSTIVPSEFLEYYLESGQTILLFDGLDELPDLSFKNKIRKRIHNFSETYPGNTIIVTSRIYGYEGEARFDSKEFGHYRLAKLCIKEIEQFVGDWYGARLEKKQERKDYRDSLLTILSNPEHEAIRELARNPLLLTIMLLVHRIDAVLPDERYVLYQKCTETLLNTWHTWKFNEIDRIHQAKVDRQNIQRMQAIAYWMHNQMCMNDIRESSVVEYDILHKYLTKHIEKETPPNTNYAAEDIATAFLEFVQERAGLLIEIGDKKFSFIHLTFQEYLTAACIRTLSELKGVSEAWEKEIIGHCLDPQWQEVIRLLVAGYSSNESQEFLVEKILEIPSQKATKAQLLGGLLVDGIAAAQSKKHDVFFHLLRSLLFDDENEWKNTLSLLRACREKIDREWKTVKSVVYSLIKEEKEERKTRLRLILLALGMSIDETWNLCGRGSEQEEALLSLFSGKLLTLKNKDILSLDLEFLKLSSYYAALISPNGTLLATVIHSLNSGFDPTWHNKNAFEAILVVAGEPLLGTLWAFVVYNLIFSQEKLAQYGQHPNWEKAIVLAQTLDHAVTMARSQYKADNQNQEVALNQTLNLNRAMALARPLARSRGWNPWRTRSRTLLRFMNRALDTVHSLSDINLICQKISTTTETTSSILEFLCYVFELKPTYLWSEALKIVFLPTIISRINLIDSKWWKETCYAFEVGTKSEEAIYAAAWQLIFDGILYICGYHKPNVDCLRNMLKYTEAEIAEHQRNSAEMQAIITKLAGYTRSYPSAALRIAHCIRDMAYGNDSRRNDLKDMLNSNDSAYREIFEHCCWYPTEEAKT